MRSLINILIVGFGLFVTIAGVACLTTGETAISLGILQIAVGLAIVLLPLVHAQWLSRWPQQPEHLTKPPLIGSIGALILIAGFYGLVAVDLLEVTRVRTRVFVIEWSANVAVTSGMVLLGVGVLQVLRSRRSGPNSGGGNAT
jgi:hypothetical protein